MKYCAVSEPKSPPRIKYCSNSPSAALPLNIELINSPVACPTYFKLCGLPAIIASKSPVTLRKLYFIVCVGLNNCHNFQPLVILRKNFLNDAGCFAAPKAFNVSATSFGITQSLASSCPMASAICSIVNSPSPVLVIAASKP